MTTVSLAVRAAARASRRLADDQHGVVSRRQLRSADVPRWYLRRELLAGRWQRAGRQTVVVHNGPLSWGARCWVALLEVGPRAALDGVTALRAAGIEALTDDLLHVITPKGTRKVRLKGVRIHESRRFREADLAPGHLRTVRPAVAAVHAALWAQTDRQAVFFLTLAVQQGRARPRDLTAAAARIKRHPRRPLLVRTVAELAGGVRSMAELDVAGAMRERGLPEPDRQALRVRPSGTQYLDADFDDYDLTLEIDGGQHELPPQALKDVLRDMGLVVEGRTVLRLPTSAWWLDRAAVLDALERVFVSRGWRRRAA